MMDIHAPADTHESAQTLAEILFRSVREKLRKLKITPLMRDHTLRVIAELAQAERENDD